MLRQNLQAILFAVLLLSLVIFNRSEKTIIGSNIQANFNQAIVATSVQVNDTRQEKPISTIKAPSLNVKAAIVEKLGANYPIFNLNNDQRWPIASLTKLMTAVIALEKFHPSDEISFNDKIIATEGSSGGFQSGDRFTVSDLIKSLMLISSNDAAMALAEAYGYQNFIDAMQTKANELGMKQTTFFDPTGLSYLNQSTIDDLMKLVNYVFNRHTEILQFSQQPTLVIGNKRTLVSINQFASRPDFLGGKTGYTDDANGNLISLFKDPETGQPLLIIVLGTADRFGETKKLLENFTNRN